VLLSSSRAWAVDLEPVLATAHIKRICSCLAILRKPNNLIRVSLTSAVNSQLYLVCTMLLIEHLSNQEMPVLFTKGSLTSIKYTSNPFKKVVQSFLSTEDCH